MSQLNLLLLAGVVAVAAAFAIPVLPQIHEIEDVPNDNPFLNLGAKTPLIEGDIFIPPGRNAFINTAYRWTFPIPDILSDSLDLNAKGTVFQAFEMYRLKSCVDFKPYEGERTYIKFEKLDGCFSSVGEQPGGQVLSLGLGCDHKAVVEHELLHALGFYHMQSRQDRDDYVKIWLDQVIDGLQHNFNKYDDSFVTDLNTPYDYESVMHYRPFSFNKDPNIPTITTNIPEFFNIIGQYLDFSEQDIVRLNRMYNCTSSLTLLDQCTFEHINICGMIQSSSDDGDWVHTKSSSGSAHTLIGQPRDTGYAMYFDTAVGNALESGLLESRLLYPKRKLQCLQFFYKMNGSSKDRLAIWVKMDDGTGTVRKLKKLDTIWADDDETWKIAHVPMQVGVKFRYVFQAVSGDPANSTGGVFIDDISLMETRCPAAVWRIHNFSDIMQTANHNTVLNSPRFYSSEGYAFGVSVYPLSSYTDYSGDYTGLYFHLASGENDRAMKWPAVDRQATITVMDQDADIKLRMSSARSLTTDLVTTPEGKLYWDNPAKVGTYDPDCQCYRGKSRGWRNFIKHFDLRRRNYLKNDDLIILLDFEDLTPLKNSEVPIAMEN